jgi:hypothetical protein
LINDKSIKNSVVSVRSYLQKTIGELLNNALYELEIRRERYSDDQELFTAKGSVRFIANFLINQNS